ncbi:LOW QUALITY PROTEIN: proenkephalin-B [Menidia menidia]
MEWFVLVLMLSVPPSVRAADCSAPCVRCARQMLRADAAFSSLSCGAECEAELEGCAPDTRTDTRLDTRMAALTEEEEENQENQEEENQQEENQEQELAKRYGGFIKRIDKNKLQLLAWRRPQDARARGLRARGPGRGGGQLQKRYGGFLRKFGPKTRRSSSSEQLQELREVLQETLRGGFRL